MKYFNGDVELRLEREDLQRAIQCWLNIDLMGGIGKMREHTVSNISLHPNNKYVIKVEIQSPVKEETK